MAFSSKMTSPYYGTVTGSTGTITINVGAGANGTSGSYLYNNVTNSNWSTGYTSGSAGLHVTSNAKIDGDLTVQGISIVKTLEQINERLAILVPDPKKLEKYKALKKAYDNYKTLEALIQEDTKD